VVTQAAVIATSIYFHRGLECDACEETISNAQLIMEGNNTMTNQGLQLHVERDELTRAPRQPMMAPRSRQ